MRCLHAPGVLSSWCLWCCAVVYKMMRLTRVVFDACRSMLLMPSSSLMRHTTLRTKPGGGCRRGSNSTRNRGLLVQLVVLCVCTPGPPRVSLHPAPFLG
jgi:hypothetical protein